MSGNEKLIDIVDDEDNVVGKATYNDVISKGLIFRSANVMVFNSKGMIFVHKRNRKLHTFPGMWDVKLGGIVDSGETYEEAARRELKEEAGIRNAKLEFIFSLKYRKAGYNNNRKVYRCVYDGKMKLQESEIEEGKFVTIAEARKMMNKKMLSPSAVAVFEEFLKNTEPTEYVDVVDEEDRFVRRATEREMREKTLLHRAARIILVNKEGTFLVQKRSINKEIYPGFWDIGVSETVKSSESYESAAIRGLFEELGLRYISNIQLIHSFIAKLKFRSKQDNVNYKIYEYLCQEKVRANKDEIEEAKFIPIDEVEKLIAEDKFTPGGEMAFRDYLKRKVKAVLFDLNGVLTKSDVHNWKEVKFTSKILGVKAKKSHSLAWRKIYLPLSSGKITLKQYHAELEKIFGKKLPANFENRFSSFEMAKEKGIPELLSKLKEKKYLLGVLTNYYHGWAFAALEKIGALKYLDAVAVSSQIKARKPSAKAYLEAVKMLRCKPEECVYIGDSQDDLDGAMTVGLRTIFIPDKETEVVGHDKIRRLADILRRF